MYIVCMGGHRDVGGLAHITGTTLVHTSHNGIMKNSEPE